MSDFDPVTLFFRHQPCGRADMPTLPPQWD